MLHITLSDDPDSSDGGGGGGGGSSGSAAGSGADVESSPLSGAGGATATPHAHPHAMLTHHLHLHPHPHAPSSGGGTSSARLVDVLPASSSSSSSSLLGDDEPSVPSEHKLGTPERRHSFGGGGGGGGGGSGGRGSSSASAVPLLGGSASRSGGGRRRSSSVGSGTLARSAAAAFAAGTGPRRNWLLRLSAWQHRHTHSLHACLLLCFLMLLLIKSVLMRTPAYSASLRGPPPAAALSDVQLRRMMQSRFVRVSPHWLGAPNRPSTALHVSQRSLANFDTLKSVPGELWPPALACPLDPSSSVPSQTSHCLLRNYFPQLTKELPSLLNVRLIPEPVDCSTGRFMYVQRPEGGSTTEEAPQSPASMFQSYLSFMSFSVITETIIVSSPSPSSAAAAFAFDASSPAAPSYWAWAQTSQRSQWLWYPRPNLNYTRDPHVRRYSLGDFFGFEQWEASRIWLDHCAENSAVKRRVIRANAPIEGGARELKASAAVRALWKALDSGSSEFRLGTPQPRVNPPPRVQHVSGLSVILPGYTSHYLFDARMLLVLEVRLWMRWTTMLLLYNTLRAPHEPVMMPGGDSQPDADGNIQPDDGASQLDADKNNAFLPYALLESGVDSEMIADHVARNYKAGFALNTPADQVNPMHTLQEERRFQRFFSLEGSEAAARAPLWTLPAFASNWPYAAQDPVTYSTRPHWEPHDEWAEKHRDFDSSLHLNSFEAVFKHYFARRIHVAIVIKQDPKMRVVATDADDSEVTRGPGSFFRASQDFEHFAPPQPPSPSAPASMNPEATGAAAAASATVDTRSSRIAVPLAYAASFLPPQSILDFVRAWTSALPASLRSLVVPTLYWDCAACQDGDVEFLRVALARLGFEPRVKLNVPLALQVQLIALSDVQMYFCDEAGSGAEGSDRDDAGLQVGECGFASFLRSEPLKLFVDSPRLGRLYPHVRNVLRMEVARTPSPAAQTALAKEATEATVVLPDLDATGEDAELALLSDADRLKVLYPALPASRLKVVSFAALQRAHKPHIRVLPPASAGSSSSDSAGLSAFMSRLLRVWDRKQRRLREGNLPEFAENYAPDYPSDWILKPTA